jgi:thymidylate synthase
MKNTYEAWYMEQLGKIITEGQFRMDRTGTGVYSLPNLHYTHDLRKNYPGMFSRFFNIHQPITEKIWMLSGESNIRYLKDNGCPFWNSFATGPGMEVEVELSRFDRILLLAEKKGVPYGEALAIMGTQSLNEIEVELDRLKIPNFRKDKIKEGELGPVYGSQWRYWPNPDGTTFDQIQYALDTLKVDPNSRRVVVDCWNPSFLPDPKKTPKLNAAEGNMALTPCHLLFGFYTAEMSPAERWEEVKKRATPFCDLSKEFDEVRPSEHNAFYTKKADEYKVPTRYIDINFTMRSNDWVLGQPANMNMYSALLMMFAQQLDMVPRFVNYTGWDCHVYANHLEGVEELQRRWESGIYHDSELKVCLKHKKGGLFDYHHSDFVIMGDYKTGDRIKFPIAVG